MIKYSVKEKIQ